MGGKGNSIFRVGRLMMVKVIPLGSKGLSGSSGLMCCGIRECIPLADSSSV